MFSVRSLVRSQINYQWLIVTYCFLILFHLLPSFLISFPMVAFKYSMYLRSFFLDSWTVYVWLGLGIACVCAYVGSRSRSVVVFECGVASMMYVLTLMVGSFVHNKGPDKYHLLSFVFWLAVAQLLSFLLGCVGSAFGEWSTAAKNRREATG